MTRQGYLILHEKRSRPKIFYFSLEDGFFRYYASAQCAKCLGEFKLSGSKIVVKAQKRPDSVPHSFFLEARKVFVKDRSYTLGNPVRVELSAYNNDDRQEWGKALFSWQRYYWRDPRSPGEPEALVVDDAVKMQLEELVEKYYAKENANGYSLSLASAKQPLSFIRRNAYSLRRSLSFSMMSAGSTPSTASSSTSSSSSNLAVQNNSNNQQHHSGDNNIKSAPSKAKADATCAVEPTDCARDKIVLAKVSSCHETINLAGRSHIAVSHRGNNQEFH